jgi:hypothetical protein
MDNKRSLMVPVAVAMALLLLPLLYVGSYYAMLHPDNDPFGDTYRFGGRWSERFYQPMRWVDGRLRPDKVFDLPRLLPGTDPFGEAPAPAPKPAGPAPAPKPAPADDPFAE